MKTLERTFWILLIATSAFAGRITNPPPLADSPKALQFYLQEIKSKINVFEITETAPNAARNGVVGEHIIYNNAGTFTLWVNSDGGTTWKQI